MNDSKKIIFNFSGYSGWDILLTLCTKRFQTRQMAKRLCKQADPTLTPIIINTPWGGWRVVDKKGNVEPHAMERIVNSGPI